MAFVAVEADDLVKPVSGGRSQELFLRVALEAEGLVARSQQIGLGGFVWFVTKETRQRHNGSMHYRVFTQQFFMALKAYLGLHPDGNAVAVAWILMAFPAAPVHKRLVRHNRGALRTIYVFW